MRLILAALALAGCTTAAPTIERADVVMVREVAAMTGLAYRNDILPTVEIVSRARMDRIARQSNLTQSCTEGGVTERCQMFAGYHPVLNHIVVADDLAPADQRAVLAHELTHFLQGVNGVPFDEAQAYAVQYEWEETR